mgnify:CR=1 FL=1
MSVSVKRILNSPLMVGACITAVVTVSGTVYAFLNPRSTPRSKAMLTSSVSAEDCKTVVFDPAPPLNVSATPIEQPGNIVAKLQNGQILTVVNKQDGWVQISAPVMGWVYEKLTRHSCDSMPLATLVDKAPSQILTTRAVSDQGSQLFEESISHFQAGNLKGAIELAKAVPADSPAYDQAQAALKTMPQTWNHAQSKYTTAEQAMQDNRWSDILSIATNFPDIRYWREKLAPIVKKAIQMRYVTPSHDEQV